MWFRATARKEKRKTSQRRGTSAPVKRSIGIIALERGERSQGEKLAGNTKWTLEI